MLGSLQLVSIGRYVLAYIRMDELLRSNTSPPFGISRRAKISHIRIWVSGLTGIYLLLSACMFFVSNVNSTAWLAYALLTAADGYVFIRLSFLKQYDRHTA